MAKSIASCGALLVGLLAAGCQNSGTPQPVAGQVRSDATAPADLQLLCANTAAEQFKLAENSVLPTASAPTADGYQVTLTFTGGTATCAVKNDGTILSVVRA